MPDDEFGLRSAYQAAFRSGDLAAADHALADPRFPTLGIGESDTGSDFSSPAILRRAELAFLRGDRAAATRFADEAIAYFHRQVWTPRQKRGVALYVAEAQAYAGRAELALQGGRDAAAESTRADASNVGVNERVLARIYLALNRRDEALDCLRRAMSVPGIQAHYIRWHPVYARLKDDPRFEEILKSAKVF